MVMTKNFLLFSKVLIYQYDVTSSILKKGLKRRIKISHEYNECIPFFINKHDNILTVLRLTSSGLVDNWYKGFDILSLP